MDSCAPSDSTACSYPWRSILASLAFAFALSPDAAAQCQVQKLVASDGEMFDLFGTSVAVSGEWAFVGQSGQHNQRSAVYVFRRGPTGWVESQSFAGSDTGDGDLYGYTLAASGDYVAVGTFGHDHGGAGGTGAAYVYERTPAGWVEVQELLGSDTAAGDLLGTSLALDGDVLVTGAPHHDFGFFNTGAAYVFERTPVGWVEIAKLFPNEPLSTDTFGRDVGVSGDTIVVGEDRDALNQGAVFVFERSPAGWVETAKLTASDGEPEDTFGSAVDICGDTIVVGAVLDDGIAPDEGSAYVFERTPTGWAERAKLSAPDTHGGDRFGHDVDIDGDTVLVTRFETTVSGGIGSVHVYRRTAGAWRRIARVDPVDGAPADGFGSQADLDGSTAFVGSFLDDDDGESSGSAYVFDVPELATPYGFCATGGACGNDDPFAGCANATGGGALLAACGSTSVARDDLVLSVSGATPNQPVVVFRGSTPASQLFGDGILLVDRMSGVFRYDPVLADSTGAIELGPLVFGASGVLAGETSRFQAWYASPGGPCGSGQNLTSGVVATFEP